MVTTVSYMPPEQAMGGEVTPKSDLYSLGAMLYEMVTGRPPFLGDDSVAIIGQHINTPPVAPTWHNGNCPRPLEALIMRLLAKNPSERPESASDVLSALDALDLTEAPPLVKGDGGISDPHALDSLAGGVFVGRQKEMGDLKASLEDALSGRGRLVTLVGEPGIGKSRTAQELTTYAGLRGCQVLWGRSYEEQGAPPYWPWVQAIRSYVREKDPEQLMSEMGSGAADIAEVVSDVRDRLPGLPPAIQLEPDQARFRLFDSIATFLKTASQRQPLVLVLDDLHWADQPSLALLQFVARELNGARLLIIGTYRDMELSRQHPLAEALGELTRERLFQRVLLRGLTQEDVSRFIELTSGNAAPRGLTEAVHTQTEGNPLFVTEVVRLLVQEGSLTTDSDLPSPSGRGAGGEGDSWTIRIPEGVREVIGRRLNRLSQRCNEALTVASVVGREFSLAEIRPLVEEVTEDRLFEILEEALSARVIEELPQSVGQYQFTHALIQETLSGELSTTRKVRLHSRIAQALEELYAEDADAHAAELTHHYAEAEAMVGSEKLIHYSLLAGERALAAYAWEEALGHFARGLNARGVPVAGREPAPDAEAATFLSGYGRAQIGTLQRHQLQEAVDSLARAFDYYVEAGDTSRAVAIAQNPHSVNIMLGMREIISRAVELAPAGSLESGRVLSSHGYCLGTTVGGYVSAQEALDQALVIARNNNDIDLELGVLANSGNVDGFHLRWETCLAKSQQALELGPRVDDSYSKLRARRWAFWALLSANGDIEGARSHAEEIRSMAERVRDATGLFRSFQIEIELSCVAGTWSSARQLSDQGLALFPTNTILLGQRALIEAQVGDVTQGDSYLQRLLDSWVESSIGFGGTPLALYLAQISRITGNGKLFDIVKDKAQLSSSPAVFAVFWGQCSLGLVAVQQGDASLSAELYPTLAPQRGTLEVRTTLAVDRLLGLLCQTMGNLVQAAEHFEDALTFCRKAGYRPELAWTCCDYADTLREQDAEGDRTKAISLLDESLAISSELGMRPLMERVLSRREILKA